MPTKTQRNIIFFHMFSNIIMDVTLVQQQERQFQRALKFPSGSGPSGVYYLLRCFPGIYQLPSGKFVCYFSLFNFSSLLMCLCYCCVEFINCARRWQQWKPLNALHSEMISHAERQQQHDYQSTFKNCFEKPSKAVFTVVDTERCFKKSAMKRERNDGIPSQDLKVIFLPHKFQRPQIDVNR